MPIEGFDQATGGDVEHLYYGETSDSDAYGVDSYDSSSYDSDLTTPEIGDPISDYEGTSGSASTVELDVDGRSYTLDATSDTDGDGVNDAAIIDDSEHEGYSVAVRDTDGDGIADQAALVDETGTVVDLAEYDAATDTWSGPDSGGSDTTTTGTETTVSTGEVDFGGTEYEATIDIDGDGTVDTAVVDTTDGDAILATDTDGDGLADEGALVDDGAVVDTGHLDEEGYVTAPTDANPYYIGEDVTSLGIEGSDSGYDSTATDTSYETGDTGGVPATDSTMEVDVNGEAYTVDGYDLDGDGSADSATVESPDGTSVTYMDSDGDGVADTAEVYDPTGAYVGTAHYDPSTGTWIDG